MKPPHEACDCAECQDARRYSTWPPSDGAYRSGKPAEVTVVWVDQLQPNDAVSEDMRGNPHSGVEETNQNKEREDGH
jgi:hypothetical protein